jgi:hypothetical protein
MLDSTVVIAGERRGHNVRQILEQLRAGHGEVEMGADVLRDIEALTQMQNEGMLFFEDEK